MTSLDLTATTIILSLAAAWLIQYFMSYWQLRRFYRRIGQLRREGNLVSVGVSGSAWRLRQYAVLAVDPSTLRVVCAEQLSGWTVFATLKPIRGLEGWLVQDLIDDKAALPPSIGRKLADAVRNAAQHVLDARAKSSAEGGEVSGKK